MTKNARVEEGRTPSFRSDRPCVGVDGAGEPVAAGEQGEISDTPGALSKSAMFASLTKPSGAGGTNVSPGQ